MWFVLLSLWFCCLQIQGIQCCIHTYSSYIQLVKILFLVAFCLKSFKIDIVETPCATISGQKTARRIESSSLPSPQALVPAAPSLAPSHRQLLSSSPSVHLIRSFSLLRAKVCNAKTPQQHHDQERGRRGGNASAKAGGVVHHETEFRSGVKEEQSRGRTTSTQTSLNC